MSKYISQEPTYLASPPLTKEARIDIRFPEIGGGDVLRAWATVNQTEEGYSIRIDAFMGEGSPVPAQHSFFGDLTLAGASLVRPAPNPSLSSPFEAFAPDIPQ